MQPVPKQKITEKLQSLNPHWDTGKVPDFYSQMRPRQYFKFFYELLVRVNTSRAVILMGPRRVGKTVILWQTIQRKIDEGKTPNQILYVPLDTPILVGLSVDEIIAIFLEMHGHQSIDDLVFVFDEIQYYKNWDIELKSLVDFRKGAHYIASGSAAGALKQKSTESGAGRFTDFMLPPLTFHEYLDLLDLTQGLIDIDPKKNTRDGFVVKDIVGLNREFLNYLNYGGYPEAVFSETVKRDIQRFIREDILDKVLLRDLPSLYGISDTQELYRFFAVLTYQTGNEITYESLSQSSGVAKNTIKKYIEYLEAAFLIRTVNRVSDVGKRFTRVNYFKVYITNPSLFAAIYNFVTEDDEKTPSLVETAIYSQWMHKESALKTISYARWKDGEVDMVCIPTGAHFDVRWCVEIKWSDSYAKQPAKLTSLRHFCDTAGVFAATVTTKTTRSDAQIESLFIQFLPSALYCFIVGYNLVRQLEGKAAESVDH